MQGILWLQLWKQRIIIIVAIVIIIIVVIPKHCNMVLVNAFTVILTYLDKMLYCSFCNIYTPRSCVSRSSKHCTVLWHHGVLTTIWVPCHHHLHYWISSLCTTGDAATSWHEIIQGCIKNPDPYPCSTLLSQW